MNIFQFLFPLVDLKLDDFFELMVVKKANLKC